MGVSPDLFRKVAGCFATGVTVVTTQDREGIPYGLTVNSFTSVSLDPPLVLVCLDNGLTGLDIFLESRRFAVNILTKDTAGCIEPFRQPREPTGLRGPMPRVTDRRSRGDRLHGLVRVRDCPRVRRRRSRHPGGGGQGRPAW